MKTIFYSVLATCFLLISCNQEKSLDKYFVESSKDQQFLAVDFSPDMFNSSKSKFTKDQLEALQSFDKMNVIFFKRTKANESHFEAERSNIKAILKDEKYQNLMRLGMGKDEASISYVGTENHISEFVISGSASEVGFGVIRIQGKDMTPNDVMKVVEVMKNGNLDFEAFKPIFDMIKK